MYVSAKYPKVFYRPPRHPVQLVNTNCHETDGPEWCGRPMSSKEQCGFNSKTLRFAQSYLWLDEELFSFHLTWMESGGSADRQTESRLTNRINALFFSPLS
jgi:hypothetical protein